MSEREMNINRILSLLLAACAAMLLAGCENDDSVGDAIFDMLFGEYMYIETTAAPPGALGQPYTFAISAEVKNEPFDNLYDYDFSILDGRLPAGLSFFTVCDERVAYIDGVPQEAGVFPITLRVSSDILYEKEHEDDDCCVLSWYDQKDFTIVIAE